MRTFWLQITRICGVLITFAAPLAHAQNPTQNPTDSMNGMGFWSQVLEELSTSNSFDISADEELVFSPKTLSFKGSGNVSARLGPLRLSASQIDGTLYEPSTLPETSGDSSPPVGPNTKPQTIRAYGGVSLQVLQEETPRGTLSAQQLTVDFLTQQISLNGLPNEMATFLIDLAPPTSEQPEHLSVQSEHMNLDLKKTVLALSKGSHVSWNGISITAQSLEAEATVGEKSFDLTRVHATDNVIISLTPITTNENSDTPSVNLLGMQATITGNMLIYTNTSRSLSVCGKAHLKATNIDVSAHCIGYNLDSGDIRLASPNDLNERVRLQLDL